MATPSTLPRPDLKAYYESIHLPFPELVSQLVQLIGRKLTAYVAGVKDARAIDRWVDGGESYGNAKDRLRLTFQVARTLRNHDSDRVVHAWLTGVNPELGDRTPIRLLREGNVESVAAEVLGAVRAFIAGG
jgi:hypothetical protein